MNRSPSTPSLHAAVTAGGAGHIVDVLIEERARHLRHHPVIWPMLRALLFPLLHYSQAVGMADTIAEWKAAAIFDWLLDELAPAIKVTGLEHVPPAGRCVIIGNHPTGIVDGIALYGALKGHREDLCYLANRDAIRVAPGLSEMIVPVEWVLEKRSIAKTKEMWRATRDAFDKERVVVIFPSGRVAQWRVGGLVDRPWQATAITIARRNAAPIVPLHVSAWNSLIYYSFAAFSQELRDMTLFNELLNKRGKPFTLTFGPPIPPEALAGDAETEILRLRTYVEKDLPAGRTFG